jgi:hypothetical protein
LSLKKSGRNGVNLKTKTRGKTANETNFKDFACLLSP